MYFDAIVKEKGRLRRRETAPKLAAARVRHGKLSNR